jgi:hypothetical protein
MNRLSEYGGFHNRANLRKSLSLTNGAGCWWLIDSVSEVIEVDISGRSNVIKTVIRLFRLITMATKSLENDLKRNGDTSSSGTVPLKW